MLFKIETKDLINNVLSYYKNDFNEILDEEQIITNDRFNANLLAKFMEEKLRDYHSSRKDDLIKEIAIKDIYTYRKLSFVIMKKIGIITLMLLSIALFLYSFIHKGPANVKLGMLLCGGASALVQLFTLIEDRFNLNSSYVKAFSEKIYIQIFGEALVDSFGVSDSELESMNPEEAYEKYCTRHDVADNYDEK